MAISSSAGLTGRFGENLIALALSRHDSRAHQPVRFLAGGGQARLILLLHADCGVAAFLRLAVNFAHLLLTGREDRLNAFEQEALENKGDNQQIGKRDEDLP